MFSALSRFAGLTIMMAGLLFVAGTPATQAQSLGDGCGSAATLTDTQRTEVQNKATAASTSAENFSCQNVANISSSAKSTKCVRNLCPQYPSNDVLCCAPNTGVAPGSTGATGGASGPGTTGQAGGVGRLALPACVSDGNCELDDLVTMAVNFANFLFGISGAIFLLVFVISGFRLIFFATDAGSIKSAKDSLVKAATGMVIIALAGVLTTFVYNNLRGASNSGTERTGDTCSEEVKTPEGVPYQCQNLSGIPSKNDYEAYSEELIRRGCQPSARNTTNLCSGSRSFCCPPNTPSN